MRSGSRRVPDLSRDPRTGTGQEADTVGAGTPGTGATDLLMFFGYPIVKNIVMSFQQYTPATFYTGAAPFVGLENYSRILSSDLFPKVLLTTVLFTAGSLFGQFVLGLAFALFFQRRFPLGGVLRSLLVLPWLLPLVVSGTTWRWMLDTDSGVVNSTLRHLHLLSSGIPWLTGTQDSRLDLSGDQSLHQQAMPSQRSTSRRRTNP